MSAPAADPLPHDSKVTVSAADSGGWVLTVERDGQALVTEHCDDWHRVERRVAVLTSGIAAPLPRVAAALVLMAFVAVAPLAAQEAPAALLPEPRLIARAVELVTGFKGDETSAPKDGFYAHTGCCTSGGLAVMRIARIRRVREGEVHHASHERLADRKGPRRTTWDSNWRRHPVPRSRRKCAGPTCPAIG